MNASTIRTANAADASGIARVYVRTWRTAYRGLLPPKTLNNMNEMREKIRVRAWLDLLPAGRSAADVPANARRSTLYMSCPLTSAWAWVRASWLQLANTLLLKTSSRWLSGCWLVIPPAGSTSRSVVHPLQLAPSVSVAVTYRKSGMLGTTWAILLPPLLSMPHAAAFCLRAAPDPPRALSAIVI